MYFVCTGSLLPITDQEGLQRKSQGEFCLDIDSKPNNEQLRLGFYNMRY